MRTRHIQLPLTNEVVTQETLIKRFLDTTDQLIKAKSENNYFSLVMDLNDDVAKAKDENP